MVEGHGVAQDDGRSLALTSTTQDLRREAALKHACTYAAGVQRVFALRPAAGGLRLTHLHPLLALARAVELGPHLPERVVLRPVRGEQTRRLANETIGRQQEPRAHCAARHARASAHLARGRVQLRRPQHTQRRGVDEEEVDAQLVDSHQPVAVRS